MTFILMTSNDYRHWHSNFDHGTWRSRARRAARAAPRCRKGPPRALRCNLRGFQSRCIPLRYGNCWRENWENIGKTGKILIKYWENIGKMMRNMFFIGKSGIINHEHRRGILYIYIQSQAYGNVWKLKHGTSRNPKFAGAWYVHRFWHFSPWIIDADYKWYKCVDKLGVADAVEMFASTAN